MRAIVAVSAPVGGLLRVRQAGLVAETSDELRRRNEMLEERISSLGEAVLRVSASLDLETVLREIVDSARALTGARLGLIVTVDAAGRPQDFVSAGLPPGYHAEMAAWPDGPRLFEHFRNLTEPLRVADLPAYVGELGFRTGLIRSMTMQCTPMHHRNVHVGTFFLGEKDGEQPFTRADEELLVLFALQAATAVANARTYRDEQRTRADLEALIENSSVGVLVFDGGSLRLRLFNREALRIVERLRQPGKDLEDLLDVVTARRGDGSEFALAEFPLAHQPGGAEEITLSVPDGRSVTSLVNATPVRSAAGALESIVVTLQDLAPLEEIERMRSEFLGMVSHELRTPLSSIKGSAAAVLGAARAPDPAEMLQFFRVINDQADRTLSLIADLQDQRRIETGTLSVAPEPAGLPRVLADPERGTRFTFTVPSAEEAAGAAPPYPRLPAVGPTKRRGIQERPCILVVDDDPQALRYVRAALGEADYDPVVTGDPEALPELLRRHNPRLVLLDLVLPGADGIELLGQIPELSDQPVIFISGYGRDGTVAKALDAGAVDYIVKPFSPTELMARIRAALRRHEPAEAFALGDLAIDYDRREVTVGGDAVNLTATEFELLRVLSLHAGRVVPFHTLLRWVWSGREDAKPDVVRVFINSLRRKLGDDAASPAYIFNEHGVGYRMPGPR